MPRYSPKKSIKKATPESSECSSEISQRDSSEVTEASLSDDSSEQDASESEPFEIDFSKLDPTDIRQTITENITAKYALASLAGHEIPIHKKHGYLSLTAICEASGKEFSHYQETARGKEFIAAVRAKLRADAKRSGKKYLPAILEPELTGPKIVQGIYGHALIGLNVIGWCSVDVGLEVNKIASDRFARDARIDRRFGAL